jgi:hypothetical protein
MEHLGGGKGDLESLGPGPQMLGSWERAQILLDMDPNFWFRTAHQSIPIIKIARRGSAKIAPPVRGFRT